MLANGHGYLYKSLQRVSYLSTIGVNIYTHLTVVGVDVCVMGPPLHMGGGYITRAP